MTETPATTRAQRMQRPLARDAIRKIAESSGGCLRPVQLRRTDTQTGQSDTVLIPCGATLASLCPPCAERARKLRETQCREGWHLEDEPDLTPAPPDEMQAYWLTLRAEVQAQRDQAAAAGQDTAELDELAAELDTEITRSGVRGKVTTSGGGGGEGAKREGRRSRSTRRRQDAAALPRQRIDARTTGKVYTSPDGKSYRPSMFLTLTCDSYGKVKDDGTPADPGSYDYVRAARDALHFAALVDRFIQNLRRVLGYDVQYFGAVEPQKRLAPHIHLAIRGSVPRPLLRQVLAATYHQVWWPSTDTVRFAGDELPVWDETTGTYLDPATGEVLPGWDQALDAIGPNDVPLHVARFGAKFDAQGVLAGSKDASRCIRYLTKYLTKHVADCHAPDTDPQRQHADRLAAALRYEPCSPTCANWLRYGIQPKNARPGLTPGACKGLCRIRHRRAKRTGPSTSATPDAASWSPANGPARPWPTTAATAKPGSSKPPAWSRPTPTRPATPGTSSPPPTPTTCPPTGGCCTSSPSAPGCKPRSPKPNAEPRNTTAISRQPGGQHDRSTPKACGTAVDCC